METNIDLQPKNSLWRKRRLTKSAEIISKLTSNEWNPFERCDGRILVALHKQLHKEKLNQTEDSPL